MRPLKGVFLVRGYQDFRVGSFGGALLLYGGFSFVAAGKTTKNPKTHSWEYRPMNLDNMHSIATYGQTTDSEDAISQYIIYINNFPAHSHFRTRLRYR